MDFDFDELRLWVGGYKRKYDRFLDRVKDLVENFEIIPFTIPDDLEVRDAFASDGSFITYWKSPLERIYIGGVRVATVEEKYTGNSYIDTADASNEFIFMNLNEDNVESKSVTPRSILSNIMSIRERQALIRYAKENEKKIIMVDGSLLGGLKTPSKSEEEMYRKAIGNDKVDELLTESSTEELINYCKRNDHILVGVVKESKKIKIFGRIRYERALEMALDKKGLDPLGMYYYELSPDEMKPILGRSNALFADFKVIFARLHPKANKWHRIDILLSNHDLSSEILPLIATYSQYYKYLGTPRPPQVCDSIASEINGRRMGTMWTLRHILLNAGFKFEDIIYGETDFSGESARYRRTFHQLADKANRTEKKFVADL